MMERNIGILMIFSLFAGLFAFTVYERGIQEALLGWAMIVCIVGFSAVASYLIDTGEG